MTFVTVLQVQCVECGRIFDLTNEEEAGEWATGHDCPPDPYEQYGKVEHEALLIDEERRQPMMIRRSELGIRTSHPGWCRVIEAHSLEDCRDKPWGQTPCQAPVRTATGWDKCGQPENTEWLHFNRDDSRAIDHQYNEPGVVGYHFGIKVLP